MAVAYDNSASVVGFGVTELSVNITLGEGANLGAQLLLSTLAAPGAITAPTLGGIEGSAVPDASGNDASWHHTLFKLLGLPSGDQTAHVSWENAASAVLTVVSATDVSDVNGGVYAQAASGSISLEIVSADGDLTVSFVGDGNTGTTHETNQTIRVADQLIGADTGPGTGTTTHEWTNTGAFACNVVGANFVQVAVEPEPEPAAESNAGGWGFYLAYEQERDRRRKRRRELEEAEEAAEALQDEVDREIAQILQKQEREDERKAELERLRALVAEHGSEKFTPRVNAAIQRVQERQTISSLLNLDRELRRMIDEEDAALLMLLLHD